MKICTVLGARPQFIKAAVVSAEIAETDDIEEVIIHTGQHYDPEMSQIFFDELNIPPEKYNLGVGSGPQGWQTGAMLEGIEKVLIEEQPDVLLVYGDTNSTLAGALAAVKLHIPTAHVEAGMRSFNRTMPEEINRILTDHIADINFCSTPVAVENLENEGLDKTVILVGDVMYDCSLKFAELAGKHYQPLEKFNLQSGNYILLTCHRAENTNDPDRLTGIVEAVNILSEEIPVIYPVHPRTREYIKKYGLTFNNSVQTVSPVSYFEMLIMERHAGFILTDSGGVQKEAFFYQVPCVTMRDETEWVETVDLKWNIVTGADSEKILQAVKTFQQQPPPKTDVNPYGDGDAAGKIVNELQKKSKKETI
jgi:UDP-GlcNAc3NAcA epimerase